MNVKAVAIDEASHAMLRELCGAAGMTMGHLAEQAIHEYRLLHGEALGLALSECELVCARVLKKQIVDGDA